MCFGGDTPEIEETKLEKETARIAMEKYNYLRPQLQQVEDEYFSRVQGLNDDSEYLQLGAAVDTSIGKQFGEATEDIAKNMAASGIDPSSGKFQGTLAAVANNAGTAGADALNKAQSMQQDRALTGMGNLVAKGEGQSTEAISGMMDVADLSSSYARQKARESSQKQSNRLGTLAFAAGAGYEGFKNEDGGD